MKVLNGLSHILVFHSFSRQVIAFVSTFNQTTVTNIYFGSYFMVFKQKKYFYNTLYQTN